MSNYIDVISLRLFQGLLAKVLIREQLLLIDLTVVIAVDTSFSKQDYYQRLVGSPLASDDLPSVKHFLL